jgi:hypothetical protein
LIKTIVRIEFKNVFPDENQEELIFYVRQVSKQMLLNFIGFSTLKAQLNYDQFFSDKKTSLDVIQRFHKYFNKKEIENKPEVVSREASLKIGETILAYKEELIKRKGFENYLPTDELNLFKCYLVVNEELNNRQVFLDQDDGLDRISDILISSSFPVADIGIFGGGDRNLLKLGYCTIERFKLLIQFLESKSDYKFLSIELCKYFKQENLKELEYQITYFIAKLLVMKHNNQFKIESKEEESNRFIESLISNDIKVDDDYTHLRNHPLYKIEDGVYSIVDFFFAIDKFYKSVRFILKDSFEAHYKLPTKDRSFFDFYNTKFSEEVMMNSILNRIFHQKFLIKKNSVKTSGLNEPDYYIRNNKKLYLFEFKDALIAKKIKSSGDTKLIDKTLKEKFLFNHKNKPIGIGQLIESIDKIVNQNFEYDIGIHNLKNVSIYPILLVSDRYLEIFGMNYKLNKWYLEEVKKKLGDKYNPTYIKSLTIIDIDTLIYGKTYLSKKENYFKNCVAKHVHELNLNKKVSHQDPSERQKIANKLTSNRLMPFSQRFEELRPQQNELTENFSSILKKPNTQHAV